MADAGGDLQRLCPPHRNEEEVIVGNIGECRVVIAWCDFDYESVSVPPDNLELVIGLRFTVAQ